MRLAEFLIEQNSDKLFLGKTIMSNPLDNTDLNLDPPGRGRIYGDITETIGNTPLVRLNNIAKNAGAKAEVLVKLEFFNPMSSVKDRLAVAMIAAMEADGSIGPGSTIVEPTSGNTGVGLAFVWPFSYL